MKTKNILTLIVAAGLTSFAAQAYAYDNLSYDNIYRETGQRIHGSGVGLSIAQSFQADIGGDMKTLTLGLGKLSAITGSMQARLYHANNYGLYNQIGSSVEFSTSAINLYSYNYFNVSNLGWNLTLGDTYAVSLSGASDFYNPDGSSGGAWWQAGNSSSTSRPIFLSWYLPGGEWMNITERGWVTGNRGLSLALVPEPSTYGLIGLGALGVAFVARRRKAKVA